MERSWIQLYSEAVSLLLWHAVGLGVIASAFGVLLFAEFARKDWLRFPARKPLYLVLVVAVALSAIWQTLNPSYGADYQGFETFANLFLKYGANFYLVEGQLTTTYSSAPAFVGQYEHNYVYGPVSVMILSLVRLIPFDWTILYRIALVSFNSLTGLLIYGWFKGTRGLIGSIIFLFNPLLHYTLNAGLNDSFMIGLMMLGLYLLHTERNLLAGISFGLAVLAKQNLVFVMIPVLCWLYFSDKRRFTSSLSSTLVTSAIVSLPFILSSQARTAYFEAVVEYPFVLSLQGKNPGTGPAANGLPNIGFSGIWSALRGLGTTDTPLFALATLIEVLLMVAVLVIIAKGRPSLADVSLLGYSVFLLGSKYVWNNHFVVFLPLSILVLLILPSSRTRVLIATAMIGGGLSYIVFDGYSFLHASYPPSYVVPDLVFFLILSSYFIWRAKSILKQRGN